MIMWATTLSLILIALSMLMCVYRVVDGPSDADRMVALDTIGINIVAAIIVYSVRVSSLAYLDAALVLAVLSFLSSVAVAKFLVKGEIIDRDSR